MEDNRASDKLNPRRRVALSGLYCSLGVELFEGNAALFGHFREGAEATEGI